MEEELVYAAVTFRTEDFPAHKTPNEPQVIYDEVYAVEKARHTNTIMPASKKKALGYSPLHLMTASLGILCIILGSISIALIVQCKKPMPEQGNLAAQNLPLCAEKVAALERQTEELTRERDGLNWTIGVILDFKDFNVNSRCPLRVCKPCLDDWVLFQSKCYLFSESYWSSGWRTWENSQEECRKTNADLVVIESQEEQKFIKSHTRYYHSLEHGYWIGLSKKTSNPWMWVDGSNLTTTYWRTAAADKGLCALTQGDVPLVDNWVNKACSMKNRWICETKALIKEST